MTKSKSKEKKATKQNVTSDQKDGISTKNYLIIGAAYAGVDDDVLGVLNGVAKKYNCSVIHAGPLVERKDYNAAYKNVGNMSRFFSQEVNLINKVSSGFSKKVEFLLPSISSVGFFKDVLDSIKGMTKEEAIELLASNLRDLYNINEDSDDDRDHSDDEFDVEFTDEEDDSGDLYHQMAAEWYSTFSSINENTDITVAYYKHLCKYLAVSSVQPKSEVATRVLPSHRLLDEYQKYCSNWILPYPTPEVTPKPKIGLNKTYNYFYTGSLYSPKGMDTSNQYYKTDHLPAAVLVLIDEETNQFHPRQIDIESHPEHGVFATDDGLVFWSDSSVEELSSDDKGSWSADDHAPFTHPGILGAIQKNNELHEPAVYINGGDAGEMLSVHRHDRKNKQRKNLEGKRLINDIRNIKSLLDFQTSYKTIKRKVKLDANHEGWLDLYINEHPELEGFADWRSIHEKYFSEYEFIFSGGGDNKVVYFGDILCRHGHQESLMLGARISDHQKYICGHHHSYKKFKRAIQVGCGASLGADYLNNSATSWQNQISTLSKYKGIASAAPKIVLHNDEKKKSRFAYRDKVYEVDWVFLPGFKL